MIATRRGLAALCVLALLALVAVVLDRPRGREVVDRALVPGLDVDRITAIRWEAAGKPVLSIAPAGGGWRFVEPAYGTLDRAAIAELTATLRGARWHRLEPARSAGEVTRTLVVRAGDRDYTIGFGRALEGGDQAWLVAGDHAVLVDAWVARALDPGALALAVRRPFERAAQAQRLVLGDVTLEGRPRAGGWTHSLVAPAAVDEVEQALAGLELQRLVTEADFDVAPFRLAADDVTGELAGPCPGAPDLVLLLASTSGGCVTTDTADRVRRAAAVFADTKGPWIERRLAPVTPTTIRLADGGVLDLRKLPLITEPSTSSAVTADAARVAELLAVFATPAEFGAVAPDDRPTATLTIDHAGGTLELSLYAKRVVKRTGVWFQLTPEAWAILTRPSRELRDLTLWTEDPTTLTRLDIDGIVYQRGAVVGEWTRTPVKPIIDAARVEALADELASLRAIAADAPAFTARHRLTLTIAPPAGADVTHALELGAPTAKGCPARVDGAAVMLARATCDAVAALVR